MGGNSTLHKDFNLINKFSPHFFKSSKNELFPPVTKCAFTLAEVLITLGIIGVVAAMTLPSLIANYEKHVTVVRLQKAYTQVNQVLNSIQAEYGDISIFSQAPSEFVPKYILPHYNGAKMYTAKNGRLVMCYDENNYFLGAPGSSAQYAWHRGSGYISTPFMTYTVSLKLEDGTCIAFNKFSDATWANIQFFVDVNGSEKGPNWAGRDLFFFQYDKETKSLRPANWNDPNDTCKDMNYGCAAKIMRAGWKIKDDYPWSKR